MDGSFAVSHRLASNLGTALPWPAPPNPIAPFGPRPIQTPMSQGLLTTQPSRRGVPSFATPLRYGSGAGAAPQPHTAPARARARDRDNSRDRDRRPTARLGRSQPAGPEESNDWLDALNNLQNGLATLERNQRTQAAGMAMTNQKLDQVSSKLDDVAAIVEQHNEALKKFDEKVTFIETNSVSIAIVEQLRIHSDTLEAQMQSLMEIVQAQRDQDQGRSADVTGPPDPSAPTFPTTFDGDSRQ
jgi:hypothetical protein